MARGKKGPARRAGQAVPKFSRGRNPLSHFNHTRRQVETVRVFKTAAFDDWKNWRGGGRGFAKGETQSADKACKRHCFLKTKEGSNFCFRRHLRPSHTSVQAFLPCKLFHPADSLLTLSISCPRSRRGALHNKAARFCSTPPRFWLGRGFPRPGGILRGDLS